MTRDPNAPDEEPQGGRAAERLRDQLMGRFPPAPPADDDQKPAGAESPAESADPEAEADTSTDAHP